MSETQIGKQAPAFKGMAVIDGQFKEIALDDYKGKYLVVFFYPLDLWVFLFWLKTFIFDFNNFQIFQALLCVQLRSFHFRTALRSSELSDAN